MIGRPDELGGRARARRIAVTLGLWVLIGIDCWLILLVGFESP